MFTGGLTAASHRQSRPLPAQKLPPNGNSRRLLLRALNILHSVDSVLYFMYEDSRHALPVSGCPGGVAFSRGAGVAGRYEEKRGCPHLRRFAHLHRPLAEHRRTGQHYLTQVEETWPTERLVPGAARGRDHGTTHYRPLPRSAQIAFRPVDPRGGAGASGPTLRGGGVGLDGRTLSGEVEPDAAEAGAAGLRARPGRGATLAGRGVPRDQKAGQGGKTPRFTGATRWGFGATIRPARVTDGAERRR